MNQFFFADNDVPECNKNMWMDAIGYYSQLKLNKTLYALNAYGYEYDYSKLNNSTQVMRILNGKDLVNANLN